MLAILPIDPVLRAGVPCTPPDGLFVRTCTGSAFKDQMIYCDARADPSADSDVGILKVGRVDREENFYGPCTVDADCASTTDSNGVVTYRDNPKNAGSPLFCDRSAFALAKDNANTPQCAQLVPPTC